MLVTNRNGKQIDFDTAVFSMDDDIREALAREGIDDEQDFFSQYETEHCIKYGEEWELSKANPQY